MEYLCIDTSVSAIGNGFVKVSWTQRKSTLVEFNDDFYNKYTLIRAEAIGTDLPNVTIIDQLNGYPLLHGGDNLPIYTAHAHEFDVSVHDVSKTFFLRQ